MIFEFCYRFIAICKSYFGKVDEESVKNNFVLIYELIDGAPIVLFILSGTYLFDSQQRLWTLGTHKIAKLIP